MLTINDIVSNLITMGDEMEFDYKDEHFWLSASNAPDGKVILYGPHNDELVDQDIDVILDTLIVDDKPLREMLPYID